MKFKAQEVYDLVQEQKQAFYYNYTGIVGNQINKSIGTEEYLTEDAMEGILKYCDLDENARNFATTCYNEQVFNVCEDGENTSKMMKFMSMSQINTVFCIVYGHEYVDIMTENFKEVA